MSELSLEYDGFQELAKSLDTTQAKVEDVMQEAALDAWDLVRGALQAYPPAPTDSKYQRTGKLCEGWANAVPTVNVGGDGFQSEITNEEAPYWIWVQAQATQAWMHQGKWRTDQQVLNENQGEIEQTFANAIAKLIDESVR